MGRSDAHNDGFAPLRRVIWMFLILFFILLIVWILGWAAFHVASGLIHLLLVVAIISIIVHFVRGRPAV
jgi:hypothetical protein